jgi:hypothetical protein
VVRVGNKTSTMLILNTGLIVTTGRPDPHQWGCCGAGCEFQVPRCPHH